MKDGMKDRGKCDKIREINDITLGDLPIDFQQLG